MKKNGFTFSELLIVLAILSFLIGAAITTFKTYDKGVALLYSNIYHVLDRALYNTTAYWIPNDAVSREPFRSSVLNPATGQTIPIDDKEGAKRLCRALVEYINPVETDDRDSNLLCSSSKAVTDMGNDEMFTNETVQFTATNGIRFWISKRYPAEGNDMKFFIIYADLNGVKAPNSMRYEPGSAINNWKTKDPDIFAFAALEIGRICPLGIPEVEPRYMTTRVVYQEEGDHNDVELHYSTPSRPYVYSKAEAWGYYLPQTKVQPGHTIVKDDEVINEEPLSFNGYIRSKINKDSKIYSFLGKEQTMSDYVQNSYYSKNAEGVFNINFRNEVPRHVNNDKTKPNIGGYACQWMSDEECYVLIDKYVD